MLNPAVIAELRELAGRSQMRWISATQSQSAKDRAEAYLYRLCQLFYEAIADGSEVESTLDRLELDWKQYAAEQNEKLELAPKFKRGPYAGHSTRMESYVYPEKFGSAKMHLRNMVKISMERKG